MSFKHLDLVKKHSKTKGPAKAVMLVLASRADEKTGECWPSFNRIAAEAGLSRRTVMRHLAVIEKIGELVITPRGHMSQTKGGIQKSNLYRITIPLPKGGDGQTPPLTDKVVTASPEGGDNQTAKVVSPRPKGSVCESPESSMNSNYESTKECIYPSRVISSSKHEFHPPTPQEVSAYGNSIGFKINGQQFCDFYESKGWMVGKNQMQDWQATVRTWKANREEKQRKSIDEAKQRFLDTERRLAEARK